MKPSGYRFHMFCPGCKQEYDQDVRTFLDGVQLPYCCGACGSRKVCISANPTAIYPDERYNHMSGRLLMLKD